MPYSSRVKTNIDDIAGYTVLPVEDGPAAVEAMAATDVIDLLLTDIVMPKGMSGRDVAEAFRQQHPGAGVLYSSGFTREALNRRSGLEEGAALIKKPYRTSALAQQMREILDRRKRPGRAVLGYSGAN